MNERRFKSILLELNGCELTMREKQFVEAVKKYFHEKGLLTDQQKSILEGIHREKRWAREAFFRQNNLLQTRKSAPRVA
jgi:hypothetical protein